MSFFILVIVLVFVVIFFVKRLNFPFLEKFPYRLEQHFLDKREEAFFLELKKQLPDKYHVFPKVRLIDFIKPNSREYQWRNKVWSRHIDFLICDQYFKPVFAVELNGKSHLAPERKISDDFKEALFKAVGLHLEIVEVGTDFSQKAGEIKQRLG